MSNEQNAINQDEITKELKKFNWGAAYLGLIWSAVNGCFKRWFLEGFVVTLVSLLALYGISALISFILPELFIYSFLGSFVIPFIAMFILFIYCGFRGNNWAWEAFKSKDINEFRNNQKPWNIVACILFVLSALSVILQLGAIVLFFKAIDNAPPAEETPTYIKADYCRYMKAELPDAIKAASNSDEYSWISDLAENLKNSEKIEYAYGFNYNQSIDINFKPEDSYIGERVTFKIQHNRPCSLDEKNCSVSAPTFQEDTACTFFFDDKGNIEPSGKTVKFLKNF